MFPKTKTNSKTLAVRMLRRRLGVLGAAVVILGVIAGPALARGPDPGRLEKAGWFCFSHVPEAIHCLPDGESVLSGEAKSSLIMTWGTETGDFWGNELLVHQDVYNGQPCPQDPLGVDGEPGGYIHLSELGLELPYFVCHHFDSPFT